MSINKQRIFICIQLISISRAIVGFIFICIALYEKLNLLAILLFVYACFSDLLDGYLARKFKCETEPGRILDLFGDKFLTIAFCLYAVAKDMPIIPLCVIVLKEVFLLSIRSLKTDKNIFKPNRLLGGLTTFPIWFNTFLVLLSVKYIDISYYYLSIIYWLCGIIVFLNLTFKIICNWSNLIDEFKKSLND